MVSQPGIARDGTRLSQKTYLDALWCRWYQGLPRKMGGYKEHLRSVNGIPRAIDVFSNDGYSYVHLGTRNGVFRYGIDNMSGATGGLVARTPAGFVPDPLFNWQFSQLYDIPTTSTVIFANATPSASGITSSQEYPVYWGDILTTDPLEPIVVGVDVLYSSGGIVGVPPFLFVYGHDGIVRWSTPASPLDFEGTGSGDARPVGDKIVRGFPLRGQSGPAIIMWSLSSVIIGSFVGPPAYWDFTTVTTNSSVLSSNGFIEHEGIYYWATTSGFSMFNGVVRELPNNDNKQWFLDNLNWQQRQKVFAYKVPRWSEIWWCFPYGSATECTHAVIYNWAEKKWYDTILPNGGRSAGFYEFVFNYPIMAGVRPNADTSNGYSMWQHELGFDEISGQQPIPRAIKSYYQTNEFNMPVPQQPGGLGVDQGQSFSTLEPDFNQIGDLMFSIASRSNARSRVRTTGPIVIKEKAETPEEQLTKFKHSGRLNSFIIESNTLGGNYITGAPLIHWQPGDGRKQD
jgi:hypothetical protein